jgi:hypothetical protein
MTHKKLSSIASLAKSKSITVIVFIFPNHTISIVVDNKSEVFFTSEKLFIKIDD